MLRTRPARAATALLRPARGIAPATCGELVQGVLDGREFLINCPIDFFASATVHPSSYDGVLLPTDRDFSKVATALGRFASRHSIDLQHEVEVESDIPRGKGMASSTAEISAALSAFASYHGVHIDDRDFAALITSVEPSDCVHFSGIAHVNQLTGMLHAALPAPQALRVLVVDCGGEVETMRFDRSRARALYAGRSQDIAYAARLVTDGLRTGDLYAIADGATLSAALSQSILHKPQFEDLLSLARDLGALGVNCAHSGTVLGVLYRQESRIKDRLVAAIEWNFRRDVDVVGDFRVIGGGLA